MKQVFPVKENELEENFAQNSCTAAKFILFMLFFYKNMCINVSYKSSELVGEFSTVIKTNNKLIMAKTQGRTNILERCFLFFGLT